MVLEILQYPDPRLSLRAAEITEITPRIRELAQNMVETMYEGDGIGLAAPQVGESLRLITVDVSGPEKREDLRVYLNPVLELLGESVDSEEGCLSVPEYRSVVQRAEKVRLTATDLDGNPVDLTAEGLLAICLQHECDHLDGKLFIDRISRLKRTLYNSRIKNRLKKARA